MANVLELRPTANAELVKSIITSPHVYPYVSDDYSPKPEDYKTDPGIGYILLLKDERVVGCFCLVPISRSVVEIHTCLLPEAYGEFAKQASFAILKAIWTESEFHRVVTTVPINNTLAIRFAEKAGMTRYGRNPESVRKNGVYLDNILLGVTRPVEFQPCQ